MKHIKIGIVKQIGEEEKGKNRDRCHRCKQEFTAVTGSRGVAGLQPIHLQPYGAEEEENQHSCLNDDHKLWLNPVRGRREYKSAVATVQQLPLPSRKKAPHVWLLSLTLPKLTFQNLRWALVEALAISVRLQSTFTASLNRRHTLQLIPLTRAKIEV